MRTGTSAGMQPRRCLRTESETRSRSRPLRMERLFFLGNNLVKVRLMSTVPV